MKIRDASITWKFMIIIFVFLVVSVSIFSLSAKTTHGIVYSYDRLFNGHQMSARLLASANRELAWTERSILQLIWSVSDETNTKFLNETNAAAQRFKLLAMGAAKALPEQADRITDFASRFSLVFDQECTTAIKMGAASTTLEGNSKAMAEMNRTCAVSLAKLSSDVASFADRLGQEAEDVHLVTTAGAFRAILVMSIIGLVAVAAIFGGSIVFIRSGITRPISVQLEIMLSLVAGRLSVEVPDRDRKDEVGKIAQAVQVFKDNALSMERMRAEKDNQKENMEKEKRRDMNRLADNFESNVKGVITTVASASQQLQATAQSLFSSAEDTHRQCETVSSAANQASSNIQSVALATEGLSSSISEISRQVSESTRIAAAGVEEANHTNTTVAGLQDAAQKIGEVVQLINDIASQTNLLALNATIEAARAGEAGKGFAVVASEVKNLASQTAKATEDIQAQVGQMQSVTGSAVNAIKIVTGTIRRMNEIATTIASAVEEQGAATQEIARNVQEASRGAQDVSASVSGFVRTAQETGSGARDTLAAVKSLNQQAEKLGNEVNRFITGIRAG